VKTKSPAANDLPTLIQQLPRALSLIVVYSVILALCRYFAYEIRFDFNIPHEFRDQMRKTLATNIALKIGVLVLFRQFSSLLTYFSVPDLLRIVGAVVSANLGFYVVSYGMHVELMTPRGVVLTDLVLAICALSSLRLGLRIYRERVLAGNEPRARATRRFVVIGAGDAGAEFVREAQSRPSLGLRPVFFLDDNKGKHGHSIHGIAVLGSPEEIGKFRGDYRVDACVLAIPSASGKRLQELNTLMVGQGLKVDIVPSMAELATGKLQLTKIRPVQVEDLLGRPAVDMMSEEVADFVQNKVILVTGAGGSIGSELCRQLAAYNPRRLLLVDQSEGSLFEIEMELNELGHRHLIVPLVADLVDLVRMRSILGHYQPEIIFHAAAHKHVHMMERQPGEAVKNNTTGTRCFGELALEMGIATFVMISTDKAINPTSAMGVSKRLAELHLQALQARQTAASAVSGDGLGSTATTILGRVAEKKGVPGKTQFMAVRFGNVLGSSGSVIPIFRRQIAAGGPVTVTDPNVTRYFMTIPEAVGLVMRAAVLGQGGEIFVLDMGEPMKIVDLAKNMIELSGLRLGHDIEIKFIGLKPGEKLYEELQHRSEMLLPTAHPRIALLKGSVPPPEDWVKACCAELEDQVSVLQSNELKAVIKKFVPEYQPYLD
jgi:FlaA1/EpsC-like NDP-sugar epimerase